MRMLLTSYFQARDDFDMNRLSVPSIADLAWFDRLSAVDPADLLGDELRNLRPALHRAVAADGTGLLAFKVHDSFGITPAGEWLFPPDASRLAVYLIRHPGDVVLSLASHLGTSVEEAVQFMETDGAAIAEVSRLQVPQVVDSWSRHVQGWCLQNRIPVLVVRYEDMLADTAAVFRSVLTALGEAVDEGRVQQCVDRTTFDRIKAHEAGRGFVERSATARDPFFRTGRAGNWRSDLSPHLRERIANVHGAAMARFGYDAAEMMR
jgi:hypothetical protein